MSNAARVAPTFPDSIFRAYDIRGVVPKTLTAETAYWIGRAIGSQSLAQGEPNVSVGRDGRLSGPELVEQLIQGLADSGCHVSDVGLVPTPALYYAANVLAGKSGVMLTGSHNPSDYNGFKIVIAGDTLANEQIQALHTRPQQIANSTPQTSMLHGTSRDPSRPKAQCWQFRPLIHRDTPMQADFFGWLGNTIGLIIHYIVEFFSGLFNMLTHAGGDFVNGMSRALKNSTM